MVTYGENEQNIAEGGVDGIREVLFGENVPQIRSLLLCLDWYLDPFYSKKLPYEKEIFDLLEELVLSSDNDDIKEDAKQLINDYRQCP